jgi:hypothetical protein
MPSQWSGLRLAVENRWGGGDATRKAEILLEEVMEMFAKAAKKRHNVYQDVRERHHHHHHPHPHPHHHHHRLPGDGGSQSFCSGFGVAP